LTSAVELTVSVTAAAAATDEAAEHEINKKQQQI